MDRILFPNQMSLLFPASFHDAIASQTSLVRCRMSPFLLFTCLIFVPFWELCGLDCLLSFSNKAMVRTILVPFFWAQNKTMANCVVFQNIRCNASQDWAQQDLPGWLHAGICISDILLMGKHSGPSPNRLRTSLRNFMVFFAFFSWQKETIPKRNLRRHDERYF